MNGLPTLRVVTKDAAGYLLLFLVFFLAGCGPFQTASTPFHCTDAIGCVALGPGEPIKIGGLQTLSGGSAPGGIEQERSIRLAVEKRGSQLMGHPIELHFEDDRCSAEGGANAALRIVADPKVIAIFGTNCSSAAVTAGKIMSEKGLVMISSSNTSPILTSVGGSRAENWVPGYFRTAWNDSVMGRAAATFTLQQLGLTQAAVINGGDAYSKGLTDVFTQVFKELGGKVVLTTTIDEDDIDLRPALDAIVLSRAEVVFFPLSQPESGSRVVRQAKEIQSLKNLVFIGGESMLSDVFIRESGPAGSGVYILGPEALSSPENDLVKESYRLKYGDVPASFYYSFSTDAANLLFDKLESVAVQGEDGTVFIGRQALRDALYATRDYTGLTGNLNCDSFGDCGVAKLHVVRLEGSARSAEDLRSHIVYTFTAPP